MATAGKRETQRRKMLGTSANSLAAAYKTIKGVDSVKLSQPTEFLETLTPELNRTLKQRLRRLCRQAIAEAASLFAGRLLRHRASCQRGIVARIAESSSREDIWVDSELRVFDWPSRC